MPWSARSAAAFMPGRVVAFRNAALTYTATTA
jgi:hypothetical protein